jgi:hypothetical protein
MSNTAEQRLQLLEDRNAIQELEIRYAMAIDQHNFELLDSVFAANADFIYQGFGEFTGVEKFKALVQKNDAFLDATHHMVMSQSITVTGDVATCYCYVQAQHIRQSLAPDIMLLMGGNYADKLERIDGHWLIVERNMSTLWGMGNPAVLDMPADTAFIQSVSARP